MREGRRRYRSKKKSVGKIQNGALVSLVWRTLKSAGLVMNLNTGETHWISNITSTIFTVFTFMQLIELYVSKDDTFRVLECTSIFCFSVMAVCKIFTLRWYGKKWGSLLKEMIKIENSERNEENALMDDEFDNENDFRVSTFIERYTKSFRSRFKVLLRIYSLTVIVYITSPFVEYALKKYRYQRIVKYPHVLPVWTPLDGVSVYGYLLTVILEIIATVYGVGVHTVFDTAAVGLMTFIQGQFYLLHAKSERIGGSGKIYKLSEARDNLDHTKIKSCHRIHLVLLSFVKKFNQLTKNIFGFYFLMSAAVLCSVAVQLKTELSATHLISLLQYMAGILTQLFILCYHGDAVQNESAVSVGRGPLGSAWWCLNPRIRKELILLHMGMSTQYQMDAAPFFFLNLPSFVQIVRTAYSCYAVLKQV